MFNFEREGFNPTQSTLKRTHKFGPVLADQQEKKKRDRTRITSRSPLCKCMPTTLTPYIHTCTPEFYETPILEPREPWVPLQCLMDSMYRKLKGQYFQSACSCLPQDCVGLAVTQQNHFFCEHKNTVNDIVKR